MLKIEKVFFMPFFSTYQVFTQFLYFVLINGCHEGRKIDFYWKCGWKIEKVCLSYLDIPNSWMRIGAFIWE